MSELENITVKRLLTLNDPSEYEVLLYLNSSDTLKGRKAKEFMKLEYDQVIEIRQQLEQIEMEGLVNMFSWVFGISVHQLMKLKVKEFYPAFNHIMSETNKLVKAEEHLSDDDPIWRQAGGDRMARYGILGILVSLAQQFHTDTDTVKGWEYGKVFSLLMWNKDYNEVSTNYQRIKSKAG